MHNYQLKFKKRKIYLQYYYRCKFRKIEIYLRLLRFILKCGYIPKQPKYFVIFYLSYILKYMTRVVFSKVCKFTGHYRSVNLKFGLHRLSLITQFSEGTIPGITSKLS